MNLAYPVFGTILFTTVLSGEVQIFSDVTRFQSAEMPSQMIVLLAFILFPFEENIIESKWKFILIITTGFILAGLSGHRIALLSIILLLCIKYIYMKNISRLEIIKYAIILLVLFLLFSFFFIEYLPDSFQRSLAFLPFVDIQEDVLLDALDSSDFRIAIWETVSGEIQKYLLLGKGIAFSADDYLWASKINYFSIDSFIITGNFDIII